MPSAVNDLVMFSPARSAGGTASLFARVAQYWSAVTGKIPTIIDYPDGATATYLNDHGVEFTLREHEGGQVQHFSRNETLLIHLLSARSLGHKLLPHPDTKLLLWSTHPQDAFKWIPTFQAARTWSTRSQRKYASWVHPRYHRTLRAVFETAISAGGLIAMDEETQSAIVEQFDLACVPTVIPIFTARPELNRHPSSGDMTRLCWVGRLTDFKLQPVLTVLAEVARLSRAGRAIRFDIVGDGAEYGQVADAVSATGIRSIHMHGTIRPSELEKFLAESVDVFIGHGTAILEAAKLGIPCLLLDGFYFPSDAGLVRVKWLYEQDTPGVGRILSNPSQFRGISLRDALENAQDLEMHGWRCKEHWLRFHDPVRGVEALTSQLSKTTLTYRDLNSAGMQDFDWLGRLAIGVKRRLTRKKY
jgi:hypothetical protein